MKEKQKIHYSVWKRFVDGIYTCKDIEELLADKKTDRSRSGYNLKIKNYII